MIRKDELQLQRLPFDDVGETITLKCLDSYQPIHATLNSTQIKGIGASDGDFHLHSRYKDVQESAWMVLPATPVGLQTFHKIERWMEESRNRRDLQFYVRYKKTPDGEYYRSPLLNGSTLYSQGVMDWQYHGVQHFKFKVTWMRKYYWEGELNRVPSPPTTTALNGSNNFIDILGKDVIGTLPTPIRLSILNKSPIGEPIGKLWIYHNTGIAPDSFKHIAYGGGGQGNTVGFSLNNSGIGALSLQDIQIAVIKKTELQTEERMWWVLKWGEKVVWQGLPFYDTKGGIQETGVFPMPRIFPWHASVPLFLVLNGQNDPPYEVHYIQLSPLASRRVICSVGPGLEVEEVLNDNQIEGYLNSSTQNPFWVAEGTSIMLAPGQNQRIYFNAWGADTLKAHFSYKAFISLHYRPRKLVP